MLKPKNNEKRGDFINRCMSDAEMINRYPDERERYNKSLSFWNVAQIDYELLNAQKEMKQKHKLICK